jgi:nicotinamidase-related amidase
MRVLMGEASWRAASERQFLRGGPSNIYTARPVARRDASGMSLARRDRMAKTASRTALLLIDFMNPLDFDGGRALARQAVPAAQRCAALKRRLARARVPAIYCNDNFGHWESDFEAVVERCRAQGGAAARLVELLEPGPDDRSILKPRHSAFFGTPLEFLLDELGVNRLVLTGIAADNCIMFTAHDAYLRKYALRIPVDCVASERESYRRSALAHMARVVKADVRPSSAG